jgi:hypothetical protein
VWVNYKLLQIFDRFSLYLCMQPRQERTLGPAPVRYDRSEVELHFRPDDDNAVRVDPYPFGETSLAVSVPARYISANPYESDEKLREALAAAPEVTLQFTLRA